MKKETISLLGVVGAVAFVFGYFLGKRSAELDTIFDLDNDIDVEDEDDDFDWDEDDDF